MKIFIYPTFDSKRDKSGNRYIQLFREAFEKHRQFTVLNRFSRSETLGLLLNADADAFILHWVDLIPSKPLGLLQEAFFRLGVRFARFRGKKIIWVLHNKAAHDDQSDRPARMMAFMSIHSDAVLTHSEEGVRFYETNFPESRAKCTYIPHPAYTQECFAGEGEIKYDYIIWGNISPRKNILEFVKFAAKDEFFKNKKILLCGHCQDSGYDKAIREALPPSIEYHNKFFTDLQLRELISSARAILFTYEGKTVLSSGALIYSLNYAKPIIGPKVGSFADLEDIVACYDNFSDIPSLPMPSGQAAMKYVERNNWSDFPEKFLNAFLEKAF